MSDPILEPTSPSSPPPSPTRRGPGTLFWVFLTTLVALLLFSFIFLQQLRSLLSDMIGGSKTAVIETIEVFRPELVINNFNEWKEMTITPGEGNRLEIATAEASETFTRTSDYKIGGRTLPLSTNVSEIVVPATYRFYINIDEEWNLVSDGTRLIVRAPRVRPTLPVAFDTSRVEKKTSAGWMRWDADKELADLESKITEQLGERAALPETIAKIEDEGRLAVARFVRQWLVKQEAWGDNAFNEIVVIFEGEPESSEIVPKSLRFDRSMQPQP